MLLTTRYPRPITRVRIAPIEVPAHGRAIVRVTCTPELLQAPSLEVDEPRHVWIVHSVDTREGFAIELGIENVSDEPATFAGWIAPQLHEDEGPNIA